MLVLDCSCRETTVLNVDPVRIEQVLINLLTNAAKYTDPGGRITVSCSVSDNALSLRVHDNGHGIEPEHLAHIFDSFW